jgi:DNA invertase Pin-like site-specific DNA recombinase
MTTTPGGSCRAATRRRAAEHFKTVHRKLGGLLHEARDQGKRVALYVRVSTDRKQTITNQKRALDEIASNHGWKIVAVFKDEGISGIKGREKRPGFDALLHGITRRDFDMVAAWSVDRLGRSLQDLIGFLNELKAKDVDLYLHQQSVDTSTPAGRALFQMLGVFAEFERAMIIERVRTGLKRAKADGKTLGRRKISAEIEAQIREQLALGLAIRKIATLVEVVLRCS